jgi:WD40 repeat protein
MSTHEPNENSSEPEDLLYDILVYREWPQHQDARCGSVAEIDNSNLSQPKSSWSSYLTNWSAAAAVAALWDPPQEVLSLLQARPSWKFCLSTDGTLLAVLQETLLEFYSCKDNFSVSLAKVRLQKDSQVHQRLLAWSPDSSLLVVTSSKGAVDLYDAFGYLVYSVFSQRLPQNEVASEELGGQSKGFAYVGAFFTDCRVRSRDWLCELMLVDYRGKVNSFLLSPSGYQEYTTFSLTHHYSHGVTSVSFNDKHSLLCLAGPVRGQGSLGDSTGPSSYGLTTWRLLGDTPHYEMLLPHDYIEPKQGRTWFYSKMPEQDHIFMLEGSPDFQHLCAVHVSGMITVWQMPGLRLVKKWHPEEQPCHDDMNPTLMQNPRLKKRKKQFLIQNNKWTPLDVKWWNDEAVVVGRYSGGVTIITLKDSDRNLLGESAEFFAGPPVLSKVFGKGFFVLEMETSSRKQKARPRDDSESHADDGSFRREESEDSSDEDEDTSLMVRGKRMAASMAYMMTESEMFAPPRKRPRITYHTYKLLALLSTTPEELYARKIEMEEYGEALILAQHYNLDSDQVYERQWKLSNLSATAIADYLTKVKRRSLVLRECLTTVPNDVDAIRTLLEYGLQETDLSVLEMMAEGGDNDGGRCIKPNNRNVTSDHYLSEEEEAERKDQEEQSLLARITWDNLTVNQRDLLAQRKNLVKYLDRLECCFDIVERYQRYTKDAFFEKDFYVKFRDQAILEAAIEFAHEGKSRAVAALLERYPDELKEYQLSILSNFPESLSPDDYADLVPSIDDILRPRQVDEDDNISKDWIEYEFVREKTPDHFQGFEASDIPFSCYKAKLLSRSLLTHWIHERARHIEAESSLADHALALLQYASEYCGVAIDLRLHHQLTTLEVMMYDMQCSSMLSLKRVEQMSDLEVLIALMEPCTKETFLAHIRRFLLPYLDRLEQLESGSRKNLLQNYLLHCSATSLVLPFELIKNSQQQQTSVFMSFDECVSIGLDCIYAHESDGETDESEIIVELATFLKKKCRNQHVLEEIEDILDIMRAIKLLKKFSILKTLHYFKACRGDKRAMEDLFLQVTRRAEGRKPRLNVSTKIISVSI